jgi:hypothetical protein
MRGGADPTEPKLRLRKIKKKKGDGGGRKS